MAEVDIGAVFNLLGSVAAEVRGHTGTLAEHGRILAEHGRKLNDLSSEMKYLREAVTQYHSAVLGHGMLISEIDARLRRVEQHLGLPSLAVK